MFDTKDEGRLTKKEMRMIIISVLNISGIVIDQHAIDKLADSLMVNSDQVYDGYVSKKQFVENAMKIPIMKTCFKKPDYSCPCC